MDDYFSRGIFKIIRIEYGKNINELDILLEPYGRPKEYPNHLEWYSTEDLIERNYKILTKAPLLYEKR